MVAYWGGSGRPDIPQGFPSFVTAFRERHHWITVDCAWLARLGFGLQGTLSLYEDVPNYGENVGTVFHEPNMAFGGLKMDGAALYAKPAKSFPPLEAVCLHGSPEVEEWLKSQELERYDYEAIHSERYRSIWQDRCPLFTNECAAMLGGWHVMWPEDDFYTPPEMKLLVWTFKDAEPYAEIWRGARNFLVRFRIT